MKSQAADNPVTMTAIGLLAYCSADIAHHVFGHGAACLALGGSLISVSSIVVNCSVLNATFSVAGPIANLALGLVAILAARVARTASAVTRLFWIFVAAFNLLWFASQFVFSVASRTDDWFWALRPFHPTEPVRYALMVFGALAYLLTIRLAAHQMAALAYPRERAMRIVVIVWLTAGVIACATAALDHDAIRAILLHALPQSALASIGLLFVPAKAAGVSSAGAPADTLALSVPWVVAAAIVGTGSILFLGPGIAIPI